MSLRTIQRVGIASSLLLGAFWASGCDDDDGGTGTPADAGVDAGGDGDGDGDMVDAGGDGDGDGDGDAGNPDAGPVIPKMCEGQTVPCPTVPTGLLDLEGCCDTRVGGDGIGVCGGIVAIPGQKTALDGCHGLHQVGMQSDFCGQFFDAIEGESGDATKPFDHANGKFDVLVAGSIVGFEGCCNETSICGVNVDSFDFGGTPVSPMLGCVPVDHFQAMMGGDEPPAGDAGAGDVVPPFCVVDTDKGATCPPKLTVALPGQEPINICTDLEAIGAIGCDPTAATPEWVCAANGLTSTKTGEAPVLEPPYCMEYLPKPAHGCADGETGKCVPGVPPNIFGCVDIPAVPDVPEFVCGCGVGKLGDGSCIPNVPKATEENPVCGAVDVDMLTGQAQADALALAPEYVCGCGDGKKGDGLCLPNVGESLCGGKDTPVDATNNCLVGVPEYAHGCGEEGVPTQADPYCLRHAAPVFGCVTVTTGPVPKLPAYVCGCGDGEVQDANGQNTCIPNVPFSVCGAVAVALMPKPGVDGVSCAISPYPEVMHGCGETTAASSAPPSCIPNTPATALGCTEVTDANKVQFLATVTNQLCGCGDTTAATGPTCISYVPATICGQLPFCAPVTNTPGASNCADVAQVCASHTPVGTPDEIGDTCELPIN